MSKKDETLKLALEALKYPLNQSHENFNVDMAELLAHRAITAIKEALAQPEQEPVVWMYVNKSTHETKFQKHMRDFVDHSLWSEVPLYGEPLANHELQCVCGAVWCGDEMVHLPDKRPPASKPWVELTVMEIEEIGKPYQEKDRSIRAWGLFACAVEEKLKEKNHG